MTRREDHAERSRTFLRNTGVGRDMLRLIQSSGTPIKRIFRQLAELGVPGSMTEELVGHKLGDWASAQPKHEAKLQALWALAEAYTDVANRVRGSVEGLPAVVDEALQAGVWYEPPSCAAVIIDRAARKVTRFTEDDEHPCRPGRSQAHERLWDAVIAGSDAGSRLSPSDQQVVDLRLAFHTVEEIAIATGLTKFEVRGKLQAIAVKEAIEKVMSLGDITQVIRERTAARKAEVRVRTAEEREARKAALPKPRAWRPTSAKEDAWILDALAKGVSVFALAKRLGTTRQALSYRLGKLRASMGPPPP